MPNVSLRTVTTCPYLGIEGYQPGWLRGPASIRARHGRRLTGLMDRWLTDVWLLWNREADQWFADGPVRQPPARMTREFFGGGIRRKTGHDRRIDPSSLTMATATSCLAASSVKVSRAVLAWLQENAP